MSDHSPKDTRVLRWIDHGVSGVMPAVEVVAATDYDDLKRKFEQQAQDLASYENAHKVLVEDNSRLQVDAERYRFLRAKFFWSTAYDRYEGKMWECHVHDSRAHKSLDEAITALQTGDGT